MAKKATAPAKKKGPPQPEMPKGHVGVDYIAKELGIEAATARIRLRDAKVKRTGKSYSWPKAEADRLVKKLAA